MWELGLLLFPGPGGKDFMMLPFDELMNKPHQLKGVSRRTEGEKEYVVVAYTHPEGNWTNEWEIWFDPQVNYLAWRSVVRQQSNAANPRFDSTTEHRVLRFKEVAPGVFFPEQVALNNLSGGKSRTIRIASFTDIRINKPLPPNIFGLRFSPNILVNDTVRGKVYRTGADGRPAEVVKDLPGSLPAPTGDKPLGATLEEPQSWTQWILPVSVAALVLAAALWTRRKWKASREAPELRTTT